MHAVHVFEQKKERKKKLMMCFVWRNSSGGFGLRRKGVQLCVTMQLIHAPKQFFLLLVGYSILLEKFSLPLGTAQT